LLTLTSQRSHEIQNFGLFPVPPAIAAGCIGVSSWLQSCYKRGNELNPLDLPVPIYLNQQIVFDHLAVLEGGFSQLSTIKTSEAEAGTTSTTAGGGIGASNVFALLGVSLKGERSKEKESREEREVSMERIHTPTSLFAKLRLMLGDAKLLSPLTDDEGMGALKPGDFVEFRAILRRNPLVEAVQSMKEALDFAAPFAPGQTGPKAQRQPEVPVKKMMALLDALTEGSSLELVGELLDVTGVRAVLSTRLEYFSDRNASEVIDGEFRVLGKPVRVIPSGSDDSINLLRKTKFTLFGPTLLDQLNEALAKATQAGLSLPKIETEIHGPAIQIVPIAIFT